MAKKRRVTPEMAAEMQAHYDRCKCLRKTARIFNVDHTTVYMYVWHDGVSGIPTADIDYCCDTYASLGSFKETAKVMGWGSLKTWCVLHHSGMLKPYCETELDERIRELFAKWKSVKAVADILGTGTTRIARALDRMGIPRKRINRTGVFSEQF